MATIPIEVIVQDGPSPEPTPTPSDSGETNIVVPDTGAGVVENGSNGGGIGSAVNIILPAIILVLAIGAIVALLIRRQQRRKNNANTDISKKEKLATVASGTIAILAATVLVGNLVIPTTNAATSVESGTAELETEDKITIIATREQDSDTITATVKDTSYATANLDFGYKVTASMIEGATTANLYLNGDETSEYYIAPVEDGTLADNTWGYRLSEEAEEYLPMALADDPAVILEGEEAIEDEEIDIYYAVMVGKDMPNGVYSGRLEYNLVKLEYIDTLTYMQDFATLSTDEKEALLASMPEGKQYILKDSRDEKPYYISRLADGNVWMTQNLDLDLSAEATLTPEDTDISENWTPLRSTINFTGTTVDGWQDDDNAPYSANPGDVYYYTSGTDENDIKYSSLAECEAAHNDGTCQHYHAGNYYNWPAAVASNNTAALAAGYENAPDSICPAGWKLPIGPNANDRNHNDILNMVLGYDIYLENDIHESCGGGCNYYSYLSGGLNAIRVNPIWLTRSGLINYSSLNNAGGSSKYWSATVAWSGSSYSIDFDSSRVSPSGGTFRKVGSPVRCLAK